MKRILIFLSLIGIVGGFIFLKMNDRLHSCETVIEVPRLFYFGENPMMTRAYVEQDPRKAIKSEAIIDKAIHDYQLETLFEIPVKEAPKEISRNLEIIRVGDRNLLSIKTYGKTEELAQQLNYAIVQSYKKRRAEGLEKRRLEAIIVFTEKMKIQEDVVEDHKTRLNGLSKKLGITYTSLKNLKREREENFRESTKQRFLMETPRLIKVAEDYERELQILNAIRSAMISEQRATQLSDQVFIIHQTGWTPQIEESMEAKK